MQTRTSLKTPLLCTLVGLVLSSFATACDPEDAPTQQRLCERFDACNYFSAGVSVEDCTDVMTLCTDDLLSSQRADWQRDADRALENANCGNFLDDYQDASACTIRVDGSIGGTANSSASGGDGPSTPGCSENDISCSGDGPVHHVLRGR